jgi:large subunit ribosomal protein L21
MSDFAIIETGGKQYKVTSGMKMKIEKLDAKEGAFAFDKVLLRSEGGKLEIGAPHVAGAKMAVNVLGNGRSRKVIVFKYHSKTRYRKKKGHRQEFTEVVIN